MPENKAAVDVVLGDPEKTPALWQALLPVAALIGLLVVNVAIYGDGASSGPNQIALMLAAVVAGVMGYINRYPIKRMLEGINSSLGSAIGAILILLFVGALSGTWMISGIIPAMIFYGLQIIDPAYFLVAAVVVCAIVSVATGSSWSTIATVGVALLAIGNALQIHAGLTVGAIISGAYFGDKISPLSDTTNLAPAMAGTDLFTHIRYMMFTTVPSITITLVIFLVIGLMSEPANTQTETLALQEIIESEFSLNPLLFIVPAVVVAMVIFKFDAVVALFFGTILGAVFAIIFQPQIIQQVVTRAETDAVADAQDSLQSQRDAIELAAFRNSSGDADTKQAKASLEEAEKSLAEKENDLEAAKSRNFVQRSYMAMINSMFGTVELKVSSDDPKAKSDAEELLQSDGMAGMLNTVWLIVMAMCFGGVMEACGLLKRITDPLVSLATTDGSLVATTAGSCMFTNLTASDQYLAIVVPGRMFRETYAERGLAPENLSRTLEDSGTVTSTLVPWNTCAAYHHGVLGIGAITFAPFCFFNIISPLMTIVVAYTGLAVRRIEPTKADE